MSVTRAAVEGVLLKRVGRLMALVQMDGTADTGSNADLVEPIAFALRQIGLAPATFGAVTDADFVKLDPADLDQLLDYAEWRLLLNIRGNFDLVNLTIGPRREDWGNVRDQLARLIDDVKTRLETMYATDFNALRGGVIAYDFISKPDDPSV